MLLADLADRAQRGEQVDLDQQCRSHPDLAAELRQLWGAVMVAQVAAASTSISMPPGSPKESDFPSGILELPCRFGDYDLLEELGRGGMGVVYRARQITLGREVAVKMILRGQLASPADRERFQAEAQAAAKLDHPGIVPVYEVGQVDGRPYFSMKYIQGTTLSHRLAEGPMDSREAATLLARVAHAIHFAHTKGVLHRDIKPSNILLDNAGFPHVTDFGLAKQTSDAASLTKTGAVLGTPAYMAPEQAAGARGQVGPVSDVYSLGVVLYHMLTGRPPFQAASPVDVVLMVLEQDPVPPRMLNPRADRDLEMIALRCLQKPTDLRYNSAALLARDLEAFLNDESIAARSGRFGQIVASWMRETHHAAVLENWGVLWMWHSLALILVCSLTTALQWNGVRDRLVYTFVWTAGLGAWAAVFWLLRRRIGPVTFVERQIAHIWAGSMICIGLLFPLEAWLELPVLRLSPVLGLVNGMAFLIKAGMLSGAFYVQALALFLSAALMAIFPDYAHLIFGVVSAACFFFPGLKYTRQRFTAPQARSSRSF
ncbi:serine/threonine protein kinase [Pirellula staleyi DSM 6068]|uniref:non-specific serine/threonine protein kinase n=1 Tax=Pirellula staleyi (strain ATCC 27377 / DSM 6068 / ICPB 4128) TaxID=530564 RepID=D2R2W4_PIRSD|nr:serine/threonine protein kinase [Pirellula staleyi DSM 6068]